MHNLGKIYLLLVDDDDDFNTALSSRLSKRNFIVTTVTSAENALRKLKTEKYDIILSDIKLTGMDGMEFLTRVKKLNEELPVILITGYANLETARKAISLNAFDYLLKPMDSIQDLLNPVYKAVRNYRLSIENKKLDEDLKLSERRYLDLFDSAGDIIYTTDKKGLFTSINKRMQEVTKFKNKNLIGTPVAKIISSLDKGMLKVKTREILSGKKLDTVEVKIAVNNGLDIIAELGMRPIKDENEIIGMQCILRDMTERKMAEEEIKNLKEYYENIVSSVPEAILTISKTLKIETANKSFYKMFNKNKNDIPGKSIAEVFDQTLSDNIRDSLNSNKLSKKQLRFEWKRENVSNSRRSFWAEISIKRSIIAKKDCILMVVSDITDLKYIEDAKKEIEIRILQMQKMESLGILASGVAHEFNNLLTVILGHAQLALAEESIKESRESLQVIEDITKRGSDLVKNLSAYAKPNDPNFRMLDITQVIDGVLLLQKKQFQLDNIKVEKKYLKHSKAPFDRGQMEQVFLNLLINAVHAIKSKGKGTITITVKDVDNHVEIRVSDTGIGMDKKTKNRIFDPFFTTKGNWIKEESKISGTGLGLSITNTIIEQHNGNLSVESIKGKGATFTITMPIDETIHTQDKKSGAKISNIHYQQIKDLRLLVVDDEEDMVNLMKLIFQRARVKDVVIESSGKKAIMSFKKSNPDIVFLDMLMPDMSGEKVFEEMKSINPQVPIVFMTGQLDLKKDKYIKNGAYAFIQKPFYVNNLFDILNKIAKEKKEILLNTIH